MAVDPVRFTGHQINLQDTFARSVAVVASPAAATETIICTLTLPTAPRADQGVYLFAFAGFTVGTNGVSADLKIRRTDASGTTKADTGAVTVVAANLAALACIGYDALGAVANQVYVATLTIASGSAASTVSNVGLFAVIV